MSVYKFEVLEAIKNCEDFINERTRYNNVITVKFLANCLLELRDVLDKSIEENEFRNYIRREIRFLVRCENDRVSAIPIVERLLERLKLES